MHGIDSLGGSPYRGQVDWSGSQAAAQEQAIADILGAANADDMTQLQAQVEVLRTANEMRKLVLDLYA